MMNEFPAQTENQATLENWRSVPFNKWAFHHVREIVPSADIANAPDQVQALEKSDRNLQGLAIPTNDGNIDLYSFLEQTNSDGFVVLHKGCIVTEQYANGMTAITPHILMSVSKSMLGLLAGILVEQSRLKTEALVSEYIPELGNTAYKDATVRNLLDMRAGIEFNEDYLLTSGPLIEYRKATGWNPLGLGETASDLRTFFRELTDSDGPHNGRFHYVSPNTDLMAWIIERATGKRYADLMSELLWQPMGAERSAYITVDRLGAARAAGGMCVTTRDLARVGQLMVNDGCRGDNQIVPTAWIDDIQNSGDAEAWQVGDFVEHFPGLPFRYRSKWFVLELGTPILMCLGIHGQYLFVDRANDIVIAKHSSHVIPLEDEDANLNIRAAIAIRDYLV